MKSVFILIHIEDVGSAQSAELQRHRAAFPHIRRVAVEHYVNGVWSAVAGWVNRIAFLNFRGDFLVSLMGEVSLHVREWEREEEIKYEGVEWE